MHTEDKTLKIRAPIDRHIHEHDFETKLYLIIQKETFRHKLKKSGCSLKKGVALNQDSADRYLFIGLNPKWHVGILEG